MTYQRLDLYKTPSNFRGKNKFVVQIWWLVQALLFKTSPQVLYGWRRFLLRLFGAKIGKGVIIRPSATITYPWKLSIGDFSWIGNNVVLYNLEEIIIGDNVVISQKSYLCTGLHDYTNKRFPIFAKPIKVEDECWVATDVYLAPGITIKKGTVIGARSSVFKSLPSGKICIGSPAKVIKDRIFEEKNNINRS